MLSANHEIPDFIDSIDQLEQVLTNPTSVLLDSVARLQSPLVILGAGGKMGPTLAVLAKRAAEAAKCGLEVIAASRYRNQSTRDWLDRHGVKTVVCDVFNREQVAELPDSVNVIYLVGMKFGTATDPVSTWVTNTLGPIIASERFAGSKIVALSTGNVYPLSEVAQKGSVESDPLTPIGEYANAAVARERLFQHYAMDSHFRNPTTLVRLNYANDLRYGILSDIAGKIYRGVPVSIEMAFFNAIWQGDANGFILRCFDLCDSPAVAVNVTSPEIYNVREAAVRLGELLGRTPILIGQEASTALLSNTERLVHNLGVPRVDFDRLLNWVAHWTKIDGTTLGKPTHFECRDGRF